MTSPDAKRSPSTARIVGMILLGTLLLMVLALVAPWVLQQQQGTTDAAPSTPAKLPWVIQVHSPEHSEVFGLQLVSANAALPGTTLDQAAAQWPQEVLEMAVVQSRTGQRTLEAFLASVSLNGIQGKLVLTATASAPDLDAWADRAVRSESQESGSRRLLMTGPDVAQARTRRIDGLVLLPSARLDEEVLVQRLGPPAERIAEAATGESSSDSASVVHLMYPDRGLAVAVDSRGKNRVVFQYVPPADFDTRLRQPLRAGSHDGPQAESGASAAR